MYDEGENRLNKLERKLYSRKGKSIIDAGRSELSEKPESTLSDTWEGGSGASKFDTLAARVVQTAGTKQSFAKKFFISSLVFFAVSIGVAAYVFFGGSNMVSSKNVDITVVGPAAVGAGQEVSLDVAILNSNTTDLEAVSIVTNYPSGTRVPKNLSEDAPSERFDIGVVKSGEAVHQIIKLVFFGEKEDVKSIKITVEYRVKNSSALFYKEKNYDLSISSAPIILTPIYQKEVNSGQDMNFKLEVASNADKNLEDIIVSVEYPFGFVFKSATPTPSYGNNVWKISSLARASKTNINIAGSVLGQDNEERVFRVNAGTQSPDDERRVSVSMASLSESILIKKPFFGLNLSVNGSMGDVSIRGGSSVDVHFGIMNNTPNKIYNVSAIAYLSGGALDNTRVVPNGGGFFQSYDNTILWDKRSDSGFSEIDPGSKKTLSFSFTPKNYSSVLNGSNPEVQVRVVLKGDRVSDSGATEPISTVETKIVKLATDVSLSARSARSLGNIENTGPIPPRVGVATTYNILWSINNSFNQAGNVEVRASLPPYVEWVGEVSPSGEGVSYDKINNQVIWKVGSILPNTGYSSASKNVAFQVKFLPSVSQVGIEPTLVGDSTLVGIDRVTGGRIQARAPAVTTRFSTDNTFKTGNEQVVD